MREKGKKEGEQVHYKQVHDKQVLENKSTCSDRIEI